MSPLKAYYYRKDVSLKYQGIFYFLIFLLPSLCLGHASISGRVLNQADTKPVPNASVFINNATIGSNTAADGTFTLRNLKPGKYDLIVSIVGFETYNQSVTVGDVDMRLPDIILLPKTIALKEVSVQYHEDPDRQKYLGWFKDEFLGTSERASDCKIINPQMLDLQYDDSRHLLTASSVDFLEIENNALGYKVKYLLTNFSLESGDEKKIYYEGPVLFQELQGSASQQNRWKKNREEVYENSPMHFLRAALNNRLDQEGFRVQQFSVYANPERPSDSLINAKIAFYSGRKKEGDNERDSLSFWEKKSKLPKTFRKLLPFAVSTSDIITTTDKPGQYALNCDNDGIYVAYSKSHHYHLNDQINYLYNRNNTENTLVNFNSPHAFFNDNGVISNPYSLIYYGVWGLNRVAELLPVDYAPDNSPLLNGQGNLQSIINPALEKYLAVHPSEKVYLHLDKPYYAAGDTIYFKAYVTMGEMHEPSNISGVLHVILINTSNQIDQSIKLQLDSGITWGDFALPDSLPSGNYRIRAYTQWMRNDDNNGFFDQTIPIGSILKTPIFRETAKAPKPLIAKPDIQFFPEGGSLVTSIRSKITFKAIGPNGLGINVKGIIVDDENNDVCTFQSTHLGMGYFYLTPVKGKGYKAKITYPDGSQNLANLPKPDTSGAVLSINNDSIPKATVRIEANVACYQRNHNKDYTLFIYSGGLATTVTCKLDSQVLMLNILKRRLHTGVATVSLFSPEGQPLCERLFFVQNYDQLSLKVTSDKKIYTKREKVSLLLNAKNRADSTVAGHFSVTVVDESKVPFDENQGSTILNNLLLTSDLKGDVEQPNYYFADTSADATKNLDILLLTQGYRRFVWKKVLEDNSPPPAYQPEKGLEIGGKVKNLFNKPISKGTVTLIPSVSGPVLNAVTNDQGIFQFSNLVFVDSTHFILSAVNNKGRNTTKLTYFNNNTEPPIASNAFWSTKTVADTEMTIYLKNSKNAMFSHGRVKGIMLKEVKIKDKKIDDQYRTQSLAGAGHADQVMHADEIGRIGGRLSTSLNGRLRGVTFNNGVTGMLVIVDGAEMPLDFNVDMLPVSQVETVEVLKYAGTSIYGMNGAGGVLIITTKQGGGEDIKNIVSVGVLPICVMGFYRAREFYSPKYTVANVNSKQADLRSTIFWKPEIQTDKDGNASIEYFNADGTGAYKVVIEGIDDKGNLGRVVYRYKVE